MPLRSRGEMLSLVGFGASHFGRTLVWVAADVYAFYALTRNAGLSGAAAGEAFLAVMVFSAACDLAVGWLIDRYRSPGLRLLAGAALLSSLAFAVSLSSAQPAIAICAALVFRLAYAVYDVPHNALVKRLGQAGPRAPVTVSAVRFLSGASSSFAIAGLAGWLVASNGQGMPVLATIAAAAATVAMVAYAPVMTRLRTSPSSPTVGTPAVAKPPVSPPLLITILLVALLGATLGGLITKALAFVGESPFVGPGWTGKALALVTLGRVVGAPLWAWLGHRLPLVGLTTGAFCVVALGGLVVVAAPPSAALLNLSMLLLGAGFAGVTVYSWALLPDLSRILGRGPQRDPIHTAVASYTALNKLALGVSGGALAALLSGTSAASLPVALGAVLAVGGLTCAAALVLISKRMRGLLQD